MGNNNDLLDNYRNLVAKIDQLCAGIRSAAGECISCHQGCDDCCRHLTLFPVEAYSLAVTAASIPQETVARIRRAAKNHAGDKCPLLEGGSCLLYQARPLICRTHGYPLLMRQHGRDLVDFCPRNFVGRESLPSSLIIDLDILNTTLAAVNSLFIKSCPHPYFTQSGRLTIAQALLAPPRVDLCSDPFAS